MAVMTRMLFSTGHDKKDATLTLFVATDQWEGGDDGSWPMRKLFSLVVDGAICCNNSESEEKERTLNAFPVRVRLMNPIYLEMQWKNKAPHRVQGSSVTQHWAASARGRELGRHSGGRGESASNFVKWWMSLGVNTRFPLQISISRVLTTHTDRLTAELTARSEWGDFSGNTRTGESLTHRETEMLVVVLTQIVPANQKPSVRPTDQWLNQDDPELNEFLVRPTDQCAVRMTQRGMSQTHYRHWVTDMRTRGHHGALTDHWVRGI